MYGYRYLYIIEYYIYTYIQSYLQYINIYIWLSFIRLSELVHVPPTWIVWASRDSLSKLAALGHFPIDIDTWKWSPGKGIFTKGPFWSSTLDLKKGDQVHNFLFLYLYRKQCLLHFEHFFIFLPLLHGHLGRTLGETLAGIIPLAVSETSPGYTSSIRWSWKWRGGWKIQHDSTCILAMPPPKCLKYYVKFQLDSNWLKCTYYNCYLSSFLSWFVKQV